MRKSVALLSGLSMAALTSMIVSASAADVMVEESAFEGFYFGAHGGYAWGDSEIDYTGNYDTSVSLNGPPRPGDGGPIDGTASVSSEGALIGAQLGANFVAGNGFLIGAEVSASWGAIAGDEIFDDGDVTVNVEQNISALGLAQAKLGWAHDRFAIYGLGGLAIGQVETSASLGAGDGFPLDINLDDDRTMTG
jgi:outer membrane immunogenic protein